MTDITDDMIETVNRVSFDVESEWAGRANRSAYVGQAIREAAYRAVRDVVAGRVVLDQPASRRMIEFCRACRDELDEVVPAEFILWGKLLPPEQLGPRCALHTADYIGAPAMSQIDQWAIFDLRPFNRALGVSGVLVVTKAGSDD